jgi:ribonucleoside-diphosphate reductase alpha chain
VDYLGEGFLSAGEKMEMKDSLSSLHFSPGGRVWFGSRKQKARLQNCALFGVGDSAEGWAKLLHDVTLSLTGGMGIGVDYSEIREKGAKIKGSGGTASGPLSLINMVNEVARHIRQGNTRRAACYASLHWKHPDTFEFITAKNWTEEQKQAKAKDVLQPAPLDIHNISVRFDNEFLEAFNDEDHEEHEWACDVWDALTENMFRTGEPGIQFDSDNQIYRNG